MKSSASAGEIEEAVYVKVRQNREKQLGGKVEDASGGSHCQYLQSEVLASRDISAIHPKTFA